MFYFFNLGIMNSFNQPHDSNEVNNYFWVDLYSDVSVELTDYWKEVIRNEEIYYAQAGKGDREIRKKYTNWNVFDAEKYVENEIMPKYNGLCRFKLRRLIQRFWRYTYAGAEYCFKENKIYFSESNNSSKGNKSWAKKVSDGMAKDLAYILK